MNFFRMIKMDFKRMLLSGKFYFAIAGAMLVTVLNISQEAMQSRWNVSVILPGCQQPWCGCIF